MKKKCYVCGRQNAETRALGEHGQDICLMCLEEPEWRALAADNLGAVVNATSLISPTGMVTIDGEEVRPMTPNDVWATPQGNN